MELLRNALHTIQSQLPSIRQPQLALPSSKAHAFAHINDPYGLWSPPCPGRPLVVNSPRGLGLWSAGGGNIDSSGAIFDGSSPIVFSSDTGNTAAKVV